MKTVMIVEDNPEGRDMYARALEARGYHVVQAGDGAEAVRRATASPPDMVLMNLSVPLVSGVDAVEILKSHPATEHIPVVVITGHTSAAVQEETWAAGCDDYLSKPLAPRDLLEAVAATIGPGAGAEA